MSWKFSVNPHFRGAGAQRNKAARGGANARANLKNAASLKRDYGSSDTSLILLLDAFVFVVEFVVVTDNVAVRFKTIDLVLVEVYLTYIVL